MTVLSSHELSQMRDRPHRTITYLAVFEPNTVFAAQIDMSGISKGERVIDVSGISGTAGDVARGMTAYIGTRPGGRDKGLLRVISATSSTITLAENALDWIDGWYITVAKFFEPWAVFPRIVLDDDNVPTFYKDFNIPYSDQNESFDPVVNMGPNEAGFLVTGAHSVYWSSSGTFDPADGSIPTGYSWFFEGGDPTGSGERDPGYVHYTGAGHFTTRLTVTTDDGKEFTGYRHVMVYDRPNAGPNRPIVQWGVRSLDGSRGEGGYTLSAFVRERADFDRIKDGALVVVFTEQWQGGERVSVGGNAENRSHILFSGYIEDESIFRNPVTDQLEFRARSVTGIMESLSTYSATLESKDDPVTWNEMEDMTVDKAIIHFLRWHSTVLRIADFSPTDDDKNVQYIDFGRGNLQEAVSEIYESTIGAQIVSDRQGKLWSEIDVSLRPTGSRGVDTMLVVTDQDWRNEIAIERRDRDELAYMEMGGIHYSGNQTGTFDAYLAGAPGDVAGYFGSVERTQGLVIGGQDHLNQFVGLAYARANAEYPEVTVPLAGDYRNVDIAPQERLVLSLDEEDTYRGIVWADKPFIPQEIAFDVLPESQAVLMDVTSREETHGPPGVSIEIPEDPPWDSGDVGDWEIDFPPLIPLPPLPPPIGGPPSDTNVVYAVWGKQIARTRNFFDPVPNWEAVNRPSGEINEFYLSPQDPRNTAYILSFSSTIYKTTNLDSANPTWSNILSQGDAGDFGQGTSADPTVTSFNVYYIGMAPNQPGVLLCPGNRFPGVDLGSLGNTDERAAVFYSLDGGGSWDHYNELTDPTMHDSWQDQNQEQKIMLSPHGNSIAYINTWAGGVDQLWRTINLNHGWLKMRDENDAADQNLILREIPLPDNPGSDKVVFTHGNSLYIASSGGLSPVVVSPFWGGFEWYPPNGEAKSQITYENVYTHPRDANMYALLRRDGNVQTRFARWLGGSWEQLHVFGNSQATIWPLGHNPSNEFHWMALAEDSDGFIWGSEDKGETWTIRQGDFASTVGDPNQIDGFGRRFIGAVWT